MKIHRDIVSLISIILSKIPSYKMYCFGLVNALETKVSLKTEFKQVF